MASDHLENLLIRFITDNQSHIYRLAYSYVKNQQDALDIVQESIHKAISAAATLRESRAIKSWLYRIVVNTSLDFLRKQKRVQLVDEATLELYGTGMEDVYQDLDLEKALEELPHKYQSVVVLRYFEDLKIEEVAEVLSENVSTIKTRLYQALRMLRVKLSDGSLEEVK
ncbi:RNA polymerase sigma factor [Paenibacillus eucommiae]|uniref:RNA polymerase sigma-70 factor (ECF subfamily) n=1 Tax=Paenibacillus eucommiae TaxID=1355755 RepID=A0ABS4J3B5_9BACL|nr:RNA polymerase sigma factor [Paenibacillus eucommiae]MBP1993706.1 RNA polymerase sigma-70 factor (ECF subfamily) [Paenibacillus eucommiae]